MKTGEKYMGGVGEDLGQVGRELVKAEPPTRGKAPGE